MEYVSIHDTEVPALGLGTHQLRGETGVQAVKDALDLGYRHIDTAEMYGNHAEIGTAIAESPVAREEVFLTTKIWRTNLQADHVHRSMADGLTDLGFGYVDLLLIHWPSRSVPVAETIGAMNQLQREGSVRFIGVSNFSVQQVQDAMAASTTPIVTNQVEYHPLHRRDDLLEYCLENDVMLTAYSPLAEGRLANHETLASIGDPYDKTAAQVALRWLVQQDAVAAIPKAARRDHLRDNIDIFDFSLTSAEMKQIFEVRGGLLSRLRTKLGI